jgi:dTMP kinase
LQRKVLEQFQAMRDSSWRVIDASQPIDDIQQQLRKQAAAVVARCQRGATPLGQLWEGAASGGGAPLADINNVQ